MEKHSNQVRTTTDYTRFKTLVGNRKPNDLHVKRLSNSFQKRYLFSPILINEKWQIIDGQHRFQADRKWRRVRLKHIKTEKDRLVARIVANNVRRSIPQREKRSLLNELASLLHKEGISPGRIASSIAEETGMSYRWVVKYLSTEFKDDSQSKRASAAARCAAQMRSDVFTPPMRNSGIVIKSYVNTKFVSVTIEKKFYEEFEKACLEIGVMVETSMAKALEQYYQKMRRAILHKE